MHLDLHPIPRHHFSGRIPLHQRAALADRVEHPARSVGIHQLVTDDVVRHAPPPVARRPFPDIPRSTVAAQIDPRQQNRVVRLFEQVRKRHFFGIVMIVVSSGHNRKNAGAGRQQHIGVAAELTPAQMHALMHRPGLIHVVALIGPAAGVEKRKIPGDQQRRAVMRHRIRSGEHRARFAVIAMAVGEKQRILGRKTVLDHNPFADETTTQHRTRIDPRRTRQDEIGRRHASAHRRRRLRRTVDRPVA